MSELFAPVGEVRGRCWFGLHDWQTLKPFVDGCYVTPLRKCGRCGLMKDGGRREGHAFGQYEMHEITRPKNDVDNVPGDQKEVTITQQRRRCQNCGYVDVEFMHFGRIGNLATAYGGPALLPDPEDPAVLPELEAPKLLSAGEPPKQEAAAGDGSVAQPPGNP